MLFSSRFAPTTQALAYASATIFIATSVATNAVYGWGKGHDVASSIIWSAVAVGAAGVVALGTSAFFDALAARAYSLAAFIVAGLILCGAYSVSAALGSASGSRQAASVEEASKSKRRADLSAVVTEANETLASRPPANPERASAALKAEIDGILIEPKLGDCAKIDGPRTREVCPKVVALRSELARAVASEDASRDHAVAVEKARARKSKAMDELAALGAEKPVNTDAVAISSFLGAMGVTVSADAVNRALVLLTVAVVEFGGSVSLAVARALSMPPAEVNEKAPARSVPRILVADEPDTPVQSVPSATVVGPVTMGVEQGLTQTVRTPLAQAPSADARSRLIAQLVNNQGAVTASRKALGEMLGVSATRAGRVVDSLKSSGLVKVRTGRTGTTISLVQPVSVGGTA